jgi:hypothetical protein
MFKINALKIVINTDKGLFGSPIILFENGLNVIKGNNSTGKSTVFQSILYGLGLEELIGGKNDKTMQSVLKSEILNDNKEIEAKVIESHILLEIKGAKAVTIRRYITSETKKAGLVEVFDGAMLTQPKQYDYMPMYVHDPDSSKEDNPYGFHPFLEKLIGWNLPEVKYKDGKFRKLYLQNIFPAFVIEQKGGWTDFLARIPYYSLIDKEARAVEFLLNLDSAEIQRKKAEVRQEKNNIENEWATLYADIQSFAKSIACEVKGVEEKPSIIQSTNSIFLTYTNTERTLMADDYLGELQYEYDDLLKVTIPTIGEIAEESETKMKTLNDKLGILSVNLNALINRKNVEQKRFNSYLERKAELENDLEQNKYHKKVKEKGAEKNIEIAMDICPYCEQKLNDSLLPQDIGQMPMQVDDNISFLESQISLITAYINGHRSEIQNLEQSIEAHNQKIALIRSQIRVLKTQLTSDNRLPSFELIERQIKLKTRIDLYVDRLNKIPNYQDKFITLSSRWEDVLSNEKKYSKELSDNDNQKIYFLENDFKNLLTKFNYRSKPIKDIHISRESLLPVVDRYSLKFDSSASDFIRAIWSYTLSLQATSEKYGGNHPNFFMLDEPGTQDTANNDLKTLMELLSQKTDSQSLVFCSFKQSHSTYEECTNGVRFSLIDLGEGKYVKQID